VLPDSRFRSQTPVFWSYVRTLSQFLGYTDKGGIRVPSVEDRKRGLRELGLDLSRCVTRSGDPTPLGAELLQYFTHRVRVLEESTRPALMTADAAEALFLELKPSATANTPLPMNKQKGEKRRHAFFTCIINILISRTLQDIPCDYSPRKLTTFVRDGIPVRTLSRRVDGAFPSTINPIALWEIKEYYFTTTFGSRIADGVFETMLDGMELRELCENENVRCRHYLMVDPRSGPTTRGGAWENPASADSWTCSTWDLSMRSSSGAKWWHEFRCSSPSGSRKLTRVKSQGR